MVSSCTISSEIANSTFTNKRLPTDKLQCQGCEQKREKLHVGNEEKVKKMVGWGQEERDWLFDSRDRVDRNRKTMIISKIINISPPPLEIFFA